MDEGKERTDLELQTIALERDRARYKFWSTVIVGGAAAIITAALSTFGTVWIKHMENNRDATKQILQTQIDILDSFQENALSNNIALRLRFAHFFKMLSPTGSENKALWEAYHADLEKSFFELEKKQEGKFVSDISAQLVSTGCVLPSGNEYTPMDLPKEIGAPQSD